MHELVIHVKEVFMHERVVAGDLAIQPAGLIVLALRGTESGRDACLCQGSVTRKDEDKPVNLTHRVAAHAVRQPFRSEIGDTHALATAVILPAVIVAFERVVADDAEMQRYLAMRAAILERKDPSALAPIKHDGIAREAPAEG